MELNYGMNCLVKLKMLRAYYILIPSYMQLAGYSLTVVLNQNQSFLLLYLRTYLCFLFFFSTPLLEISF